VHNLGGAPQLVGSQQTSMTILCRRHRNPAQIKHARPYREQQRGAIFVPAKAAAMVT